jgi:hypothetical protein
VLVVVLALVVFGVQWGFRWIRIQGDEWRCQITVESWREAGPNGYRQVPDDQRHIGGIYDGDSGCVPPEKCYERHAGPFTTSLEPCTNYTA